MNIEVQWTSRGDFITVYQADPPFSKGAALIVLHGWYGLLPYIRRACERLAMEGFTVLAPDLYQGQIAETPPRAARQMMALDIDRTVQQLSACVHYLQTRTNASATRIGLVGFCMGGQLALHAASKIPHIRACVDFYGMHPKSQPDYRGIQCPVLGLFGDRDKFMPSGNVRILEQVLQTHHVRTDFTIYPKVGHGFCNDAQPESYSASTAQAAWIKAQSFLKENLGAAATAQGPVN
jgi:carboxymethylenebutenolidase